MINSLLELFLKRFGLLGSQARDEQPLFALENRGGNSDDLLCSFSLGKNHLRKPFPKRPMCVNLGKTEIGQWRSLKPVQNSRAADLAGSKLFQ